MTLNNCGAQNPFEGIKTIAVFGGTSEGRMFAQRVQSLDFEVTIFVATEYGASILENLGEINLTVGRKDESEIAHIVEANDMIVDATHPFATQVSETLKKQTNIKGKNYLRITRDNTKTAECEDHIKAHSFDEAAEFLKSSEGNILLTTGSKNLETFTHIPDFRDRLFVRVLPEVTSISKCHELGIKPSHVMALQGPFSVELNEALLKKCRARFFVTKDSGSQGGFLEKVIAAKNLGITLVTVQRPKELDESITIHEALALLEAVDTSNIETVQVDTSKIEIVSVDTPSIETAQEVACYSGEPAGTDTPIFDKNTYMPLFLDLHEKECLVVGGGKVGLRRASMLADFGAKVALIDPIFEENNPSNYAKGEGFAADINTEIALIGRQFASSDVREKFLVVAATNSHEVNAEVHTFAKLEGCLTNIADRSEDCDFYFPALAKGEDLLAGIISVKKNHSFLRESAVQLRTCIRSLEENSDDE